jgi:hypothetical protein
MAFFALQKKPEPEANGEGEQAVPKGKAKGPERPTELPPFVTQRALYRQQVRFFKSWMVGWTALSVLIIGLQEWRFHTGLARFATRELVLVPGVVDFMRVRPNSVPDAVVLYFAEYVAGMVGTFNKNNVQARAERVGEFFTPQFRERYMAELRKALPTYNEMSVSEIFSPEMPTRFTSTKDAKGVSHYVVNVRGQLERFSNDLRLRNDVEWMTITFRTTRIEADRPWFFEVEDITRRTPEELEAFERGRERLGGK